jgi:hypothetical protein
MANVNSISNYLFCCKLGPTIITGNDCNVGLDNLSDTFQYKYTLLNISKYIL